MEVLLALGPSSSSAFFSSNSLIISSAYRNPIFHSKVKPWNSQLLRATEATVLRVYFSCVNKTGYCSKGSLKDKFLLHSLWRLNKRFKFRLSNFNVGLHKVVKCSENSNGILPVSFYRVVFGVILAMALSSAITKIPSWALSEENLLFLEAWRTIDRAYVDKSFNGQSWFRYRENALRNEPMNTREETYAAIRKMIATLDDPFTRFLEPEKFKNLQSGTKSSLTGVGLSIGYPTGKDGSSSGLVVISASPGGPAYRAGICSGDVILAIDDTSTENMGIYDAAARLQGPEGSPVEITVQHGAEIQNLRLMRERVFLNPVKSRICKIPGLGDEAPRVGYIKLTAFNQNASGAVKEAIETLRRENVKAFVLDLRDNSGGLFPEGIEIAKIWLDKGVIVYICDSSGVRDIYDTDGSNAVAASEPLAVLFLPSIGDFFARGNQAFSMGSARLFLNCRFRLVLRWEGCKT